MADDQSLSPLVNYQNTGNGEDSDDILILGELVGAYQLSTEELLTSKVKEKHLRPYVIVRWHDSRKTIHFTSPAVESGRDPIWTVSTGSLFLLQVSPAALLHETLKISIWSKKNVSSLRGAVLLDMDTYFLGKANLPGTTLLQHCNEERFEVPLLDLHGSQELAESTLALRFRLATETDVRLVELLREQGISPPSLANESSFHRSDSSFPNGNPVKDLLLEEGSKLPIAETVTETNESQVAGEFIVDALAYAFKAKTKSDKESGIRKRRIKPGPDPTRVEETKFLTPLQISQETRKPSQKWVDAGSGSVGTLHLEILSCHGLPNVDVGEAVGNLTDSFVCAVFEDVMVQTPVIDDELSPHWMPWTQRAFRIGIVHPSSTLYLGVLDYDLGPGIHEPIGRVAVNISNFQSNTAYTLKYKLYPTSNISERESNGLITVRLRIEYNDEKAALLAARQPIPIFHVNTRKHKTFKVLRYTCFGEYDIEEKFTWAVTRSYIGEVLEYWRAIKFYTGESFWSLIFWRGQVEIFSVRLPVHSAVLFFSGTILIERPELIVPFYCIFAAWFMLACMSHRRETPSPWHNCNSFWHYLEVLATGQSASGRKMYIRPHEYSKQTEEYDAEVHEWLERYQSSVDKMAAREEKLMSIGDENISTAVTGQMLPVDLLERLGRYQGIIGRICTRIRRIKSIIIWEDSMKSFWITATCLGAGLVGLILPWRFILYLVGRIVVWGFLGPHMKFVDIYLQQQSNKEKAARELEEFRKQSRLARIRREEAVKLKDVKCLAFGEFVTTVPSENLPRHYDRPLHESLARYVAPTEGAFRIAATSRIPGQQLYGAMIPHTKAGFLSNQVEAAESKARLAEIEQQLGRLQNIEDRLSSRAVEAVVDQDLPDDLGYEVTLSEDNQESVVSTEDDSEFTLSLSPTGFKRGHESSETCSISYPKSKFLARTAERLVQERLDEENEESDSEGGRSSEDGNRSTGESKSVVTFASQQGFEVDEDTIFLTPLQHYPKPGENLRQSATSGSFVTAVNNEEDDRGPEMSPPRQTVAAKSGSGSALSPSGQIAAGKSDGAEITVSEMSDGCTKLPSPTLAIESDSVQWSPHEPEERSESSPDLTPRGQRVADCDSPGSFRTPRQEPECSTSPKHSEQAVGDHDSPMSFLTPKQEQDSLNKLPQDCDSTTSFMTAPDTKQQQYEPRFSTPEQNLEEEKKEEDWLAAMLDIPDLKVKNPGKGEDEQSAMRKEGIADTRATTPVSERRLKGPRGKAAAAEGETNLQLKARDLDVQGSSSRSSRSTAAVAAEENDQRLEALDLNFLGSSASASQDMVKDSVTSFNLQMEALALAIGSSPKSSQALSWSFSTAPELNGGSGSASMDSERPKSPEGAAPASSFVTATASIVGGSADTGTSEVTVKVTHGLQSVQEEAPDLTLRKTWSSASLQKEKTWIKENPTDTIVEMKTSNARRSTVICEEGLEIVAMGRLRTIGDDDDLSSDEDSTAGQQSASSDIVRIGSHGLSAPYKCNNHVDVAHFRP